MKKRTLILAAVVALTVMASARAVQAQEAFVVNIPFDFVAGNQLLPAGEYSVKISGTQHTLLLIDRKYSLASPFLNTNAVDASEIQSQSKLVFNRYGHRYFLSLIWGAGDFQGRQLQKSAREKEIALTAKVENQDQVILVAGLPRTTP
ncbi:MAG: hypothetical protein WA639_16235 [Candidatus Acidiferrum sp.]